MNKIFRNSNNEVFMASADPNFFISLYDGKICHMDDLKLTEINVKPDCGFRRHHIVEENFSFGCDKQWHEKDILFIPVNGKDVAFRVEHITDERVYFVAVDAVGKSSMENMESFLESYLKDMPEELVRNMVEIEHECDGVVKKSKLSLVSLGNINGSDRCTGHDDMQFNGLKTEAERCKNLDGETSWYWTASPRASGSHYFMGVYCNGNVFCLHESDGLAVVPSFSISNAVR